MANTTGRAPVIGVLGGSGGVGASSFAAAVAAGAQDALLVDLDVDGGGLDVLLGADQAVGARWSGLQVAGGRLDPVALRAGVVRWRGRALLAADVGALDPAAVAQVLDAAVPAGPVVLDLPRRDCAERAEAVARCDLVVLVVRADVPGMVAAHAVVGGLRSSSPGVRVGAVVRAREVSAAEAARLVGVDLLGRLPDLRGGPGRRPRRLERLAAGLLSGAGLPDGRAGAASADVVGAAA